jgi:uncharacterized damage-inducible protein DinB
VFPNAAFPEHWAQLVGAYDVRASGPQKTRSRALKDVLKQLLTYNDEANRRFIEVVLVAQPADRVGAIFSHVLNAHQIWNARVGGAGSTDDPRQVRLAEAWAELNAENYRRSLELLQSEDVERVVEYRDTKGNSHRSRVRDSFLHVVNHSSYHRGQLALLLGQEQKAPPATDYILYVRERGM